MKDLPTDLEEARRIFPDMQIRKACVRYLPHYGPTWMAWVPGNPQCVIRIPANARYMHNYVVKDTDPRYKQMHVLLKLKGLI